LKRPVCSHSKISAKVQTCLNMICRQKCATHSHTVLCRHSLKMSQHRALVVDGDAAQALDLCRRLLRTESSVQRVETALLLLERLREGQDSGDDVNSMLRLLGNYVAPTRELTEDMLSLLLFSEHRVLLIHHLPKV
jgi:hypothetical protein